MSNQANHSTASILKKIKKRAFTQIDNEPLHNPDLSFKAKGLLTYLMSLPEDWKIYKSEIAKHAKDGIDSVRSGFKELTRGGYLKTIAIREKGKYLEWQTYVRDDLTYDFPDVATERVEPEVENPHLVNTDLENPTLLINTNTNKHKTNKDHDHVIFLKMKEWKINESLINRIFEKFPLELIKEKMELAQSANDPGAYLYGCLFKPKTTPNAQHVDISPETSIDMKDLHIEAEKLLNEHGVDFPLYAPNTCTDKHLEKQKKYLSHVSDIQELLMKDASSEDIKAYVQSLTESL